MKKNQWLIEQAKAIERQKKDLQNATKNNVPEIYACFAKVLIDEYKNTPEEVVAHYLPGHRKYGRSLCRTIQFIPWLNGARRLLELSWQTRRKNMKVMERIKEQWKLFFCAVRRTIAA